MEVQQQEKQVENNQQNIKDIETTAPGKLREIKRQGKVVAFEDDKIKVAITKAFLATESGNAAASERIHKKVNQLTENVVEVFQRRMPSGGTLHIEEIQDQVELQLMRSEELDVAKSYILYRAERTQERKKEKLEIELPDTPSINITKSDGTVVPLDVEKVAGLISDACENLDEASINEVLDEALKNLYDGVSIADMRTSLVMSARTKVEKEPNYTFATARILLDSLRYEALNFLDLDKDALQEDMKDLYPKALSSFITKGIELKLLNPKLAEMDLEKLGKEIMPERDNLFTYLGLQTLYDRYFIHSDEVRFELPQVFFMRVSMGLALNEENKEEKAKQVILRVENSKCVLLVEL